MDLNNPTNASTAWLDKRYRQTIEQIEDYAIFTLDNDGNVITWNAGAERVLGFSEEEALGQSSLFIFTPEDRDEGAPEAEMERARYEGRANDERWHLRKDGRRFWANGVLTALYDDQGTPDGFAKILRDLTRPHQAEEERKRLVKELEMLNDTLEERVESRTRELKHSQERFQQAFSAGPVASCITTLGSVGEETLLDVNESLLQLTGYNREETIGKTAKAMYMWSSPEDHTTLRKLGEGDFRNQDFTVRTRRGEVLDILLSRVAVEIAGERLYLKQFYDISERKRNETQLKTALQRVMSDTQWFAEKVMEEMAVVGVGDEAALGGRVLLSKREREVLERIAQGLGNDVIAQELGLRTQTVRNYISAIYDKIGVHTRSEAVVWARERGMS